MHHMNTHTHQWKFEATCGIKYFKEIVGRIREVILSKKIIDPLPPLKFFHNPTIPYKYSI